MMLGLGDVIRMRRKDLKWSQAELADRACIHRTTVGAIEKGASSKTDNVLSCLWALGLRLDVIDDGVPDDAGGEE